MIKTKEKELQSKFTNAWETDDKEWMKARRAGWKETLRGLNQLCGTVVSGVKKKDFKYLKNYYLTGKDIPDRKNEDQWGSLYHLDRDYSVGLLLHYWLSADHSQETFDYLNERRHRNKSADDKYENFDRGCMVLRESMLSYPSMLSKVTPLKDDRIMIENNIPSPYKDCPAIFGELQPKLAKLFTYSEQKQKEFDKYIAMGKGYGFLYNSYELVLPGYFGMQSMYRASFNPNNPVRYFLAEYMRWGFVNEGDPRELEERIKSISACWYVVDTPDGRHPLQLEVAKELKQRILDEKLTKVVQKRLDAGIKQFESGEVLKLMEPLPDVEYW